MRIASLTPAGTELLFALGLGDAVVAVSHACDHPEEALERPVVTRSLLPANLSAGRRQHALLAFHEEGRAAYAVDEAALRESEPDVIVTQGPHTAPAVPHDEILAAAGRMEPRPEILTLEASTLGEVLGNIRVIASATDAKDAGVDLLRDLADRVDRVRLAVRERPPVTVAALESLDPLLPAARWMPQLIEYAGGFDLLGMPGEPAEPQTWEELMSASPDVIVVMPPGLDGEDAEAEAYEYADELAEVGAARIVALDSRAIFSRPGPRLVDALELLAHALHPESVPQPPHGDSIEVKV